MISDVLREAIAQIDVYLEDSPDVYADCLAEVHAVLAAMRTLQRKLDNPMGHFDWQDLPAVDAWLESLPETNLPEAEIEAIVARVRKAQEDPL